MDGRNLMGHFTNMGNQVARHCQKHKYKGDEKKKKKIWWR